MSVSTSSTFYFGFDITPENQLMNFNEGGGELSATLNIGSYSFTGLAVELETALNASGLLIYTVVANRARTYTVSAVHPISAVPTNFSLLPFTGSQKAAGPWELIGFIDTDKTGAATYTGLSAGSAYTPQFYLQDYIPTTNWRSASQATVNKTASGRVEVIKFGDEQFMQCNFKWITGISQPSAGPILSVVGGVNNFLAFALYLITKGPIEFMVDNSDLDTFERLLLESTPESKDGTGFKLRELYDQGLPEYYESGVYVFRKVTA